MNQEDQSNEYPIVWFEPNIDSEEKKSLKKVIEENKSISLFSEADKMSEFCNSLNMSFLLIMSDEQRLFATFDKTICHRRLANFEEKTVLTKLLGEIPANQYWRVDVFIKRKEFEEEIITTEVIEKIMRPSEVKITETSKDFCEELISWERSPRGLFYEPGKSDDAGKELIEKEYLECKEWCIKGLKNLNENTEALENYEKVLAAFEAISGEMYPSTASSYNNLAMMHFKLGHNQQAQDYLTKALDIRKAIYGETSSFTGDSYNNLGLVFEELLELQKAIEYIMKAADIYKAVHGEMHSYTATTYANIGNIYEKLKEYQKAIEYYMKALEIRKSLYGESSSYVANAYINLGSVYESSEEYEKAIESYLKALELRKSIFGEKDLLVAVSLHFLGSAYDSQNEFEKAIDCYIQAVEIRKLTNDDNSPEAAGLYNNMGFTYYRLQDYEKAAECFTKALDIIKSTNWGINPSLLSLYNNLGSVYEHGGEYQKALEYFMEALGIARFLYGEIHPKTEAAYRNIGDVYEKLGEREKSTDYYVKSVSLNVFLNGEMNLDLAGAFIHFAAEYSQLAIWEKSLYCCGKALHIQRLMQDPSTEEAYLALGRLYHLLEKQQKEVIFDKKSLKLEKFLPGRLAREFRKRMRNENLSCEKVFNLRDISEDEPEEEEDVSEINNDHLIGFIENDEGNERIGFVPSPIGNEDEEEGNSILGKRNAPSEDSEDSEPEVEKKIKQ